MDGASAELVQERHIIREIGRRGSSVMRSASCATRDSDVCQVLIREPPNRVCNGRYLALSSLLLVTFLHYNVLDSIIVVVC